MGDADSALKDAESCLKDTNDFTKGLFQKAEALYAMGDFEFALVHYHRGNKLRPELNEFRLGIQKAREAIDNSIGSKLFTVVLTFYIILTLLCYIRLTVILNFSYIYLTHIRLTHFVILD